MPHERVAQGGQQLSAVSTTVSHGATDQRSGVAAGISPRASATILSSSRSLIPSRLAASVRRFAYSSLGNAANWATSSSSLVSLPSPPLLSLLGSQSGAALHSWMNFTPARSRSRKSLTSWPCFILGSSTIFTLAAMPRRAFATFRASLRPASSLSGSTTTCRSLNHGANSSRQPLGAPSLQVVPRSPNA